MRRSRLSDNSGITMVFVAVVLLVLLSMAALAIDLGQLYVAKQRAQNVADAAALAGGTLLDGTPACETPAADAADHCAMSNNSTDTGAKWTVEKPSDTFAFGTVVGIEFPTLVTKDDGTQVSVEPGEAIKTSAAVQVSFGFARVLGYSTHSVTATATVARLWIEDLNWPVAPWAVDERGIMGDPTADPPIQPMEAGALQTLKISTFQDPNAFIGPGNFLALAIGDSPGGNTYRDMVAGTGGSIDISVGEQFDVDTEPGNKQGPTEQGIGDRLSASQFQSDATAYDEWLQIGETTGTYPLDSRIVIVPIIQEITDPVSGRKAVTVVGFAAFFIESFDSKTGIVQGRFIEGTMIGGEFSFLPGGGNRIPLTSVRLVA